MSKASIRPDVAAYVDAANAAAGPRLYQMPVPLARRVASMLARKADLPVGSIAIDQSLSFRSDDGAELGLRLFDARPDRASSAVILYCHGGGWMLGDTGVYAPVCAEIARVIDLPVIAIDYRRAPEWPSPTGQQDCEAAARWIASGPPDLPFRATELVLAGDSCGGAYAISTAIALRDAPAALPVAAQLIFYPSADLAKRYPSFRDYATGYLLDKHLMRWFAENFAPDDSDFRASPMAGNLRGLPPALVVTAELDPLRDQGRAFAAALRDADVPVVTQEAKGMVHAFITMRCAIPSAADDLAEALAAFRMLIGRA
jgi:acetyl esterase